jgi:hypothetical protein
MRDVWQRAYSSTLGLFLVHVSEQLCTNIVDCVRAMFTRADTDGARLWTDCLLPTDYVFVMRRD